MKIEIKSIWTGGNVVEAFTFDDYEITDIVIYRKEGIDIRPLYTIPARLWSSYIYNCHPEYKDSYGKVLSLEMKDVDFFVVGNVMYISEDTADIIRNIPIIQDKGTTSVSFLETVIFKGLFDFKFRFWYRVFDIPSLFEKVINHIEDNWWLSSYYEEGIDNDIKKIKDILKEFRKEAASLNDWSDEEIWSIVEDNKIEPIMQIDLED